MNAMNTATIIAGGRDAPDCVAEAVAGSGFKISKVISGACKTGADYWGELWALRNSIPVDRYPADWEKHGNAAGPIRNREMAKVAGQLIALWDGKSRGTASMIAEARKLGLYVHVYRYDQAVAVHGSNLAVRLEAACAGESVVAPITSFRGGYGWLSNFHPCTVHFEGMAFPSSEHAYQAAKVWRDARLPFTHPELTPGQAKRKGAGVNLRPGWDDDRVWVMRAVVLDKFTRNPDLARLLLRTGTAELVEGNDWGDRFWGVCYGEGENHLGRILMSVRKRLANLRVAFGVVSD